MQLINLDWVYDESGSRDLRLDFLRGYATLAMVIDHIGDSSWLYIFTGGNRFFVSAAEAFVFISGMIVGVVYGGVMRHEGFTAALRKISSRVWTLYRLTVILTLLFVAFVLRENLPWADWLDPQDPLQFMLNVVSLRQTFVFVDIPLMYTLLMLLAPLGLYWLARKHTWGVLAASWGVWLAFQLPLWHQLFPTLIQGNWIFKLPAWQLLFFNAMVIGYHRDYLVNRLSAFTRPTLYRYTAFVTALFVALVAFYWQSDVVLARFLSPEASKALLDDFFNKSFLAPGRLIAALIVFQFLFLATTLYWKLLMRRLAWLLPLGQSSLYAYTMHVALLSIFYFLIPFMPFYRAYVQTVNTIGQIIAVVLIYAMIKKQFLFNLIPR
jgi:hypothetical protein